MMPCLDLQLWLERDNEGHARVRHRYFEKPMTPNIVMQKSSAMSYDVKKATMISEGFRRLYNNDPHTTKEEVSSDINRFLAKMLMSGYGERERLTFIKRSLERYAKKVSEKETKGIPMYRRDSYDRVNRQTKKVKKKTEWANNKNQKNMVPLFVPCTQNSILKKEIQEVVKISGEQIKVVERGGKSIKEMLQRSNPGRSNMCHDATCPVCGQTEGGETQFLKGSCRSDGINYTGTCLTCQLAGIRKVYHGESSRNLFTRSQEHRRDYEKRDFNNKFKSVWRKHDISDHGGMESSTRFQVTHSSRQDPLERQLIESLKIEREPPESLLNSKNEFRQPQLKAVVVR
jgi:hypothetical protein